MGPWSQHITCLTSVQRQVLIFSPCKMCKHHVASEHEHSMSDSHLIFELLSRHIIWNIRSPSQIFMSLSESGDTMGYHGIPQFPAKIRWKFMMISGYHGIWGQKFSQNPDQNRPFAALGIPTISTHTLAVRWRSLGHGKLTKRKFLQKWIWFFLGCFWSVHPGIR